LADRSEGVVTGVRSAGASLDFVAGETGAVVSCELSEYRERMSDSHSGF
jgi:hypothetical protein